MTDWEEAGVTEKVPVAEVEVEAAVRPGLVLVAGLVLALARDVESATSSLRVKATAGSTATRWGSLRANRSA